MPRRFVFVFLIFGLTIGGFLTWKYWPDSETSASLSQRAYVWQRIQNSPEVSTAIETVPDFIGGLLPLVAEVHFRNGSENPPEIIRPTLSVASLQNRAAADREENRDAAVIRIGTAAAETRWNPEACELISNLAGEFLNSTVWAHHELQIDYDCPQKKLSDYSKLIAHLRAKFPKTTLTFTALPSWLAEPEFRNLARLADSYVLQVHSLQLPDSPDQPVQLINFDHAYDAILLAGKLGEKFEVALPTYSCFVIFEADGDRVYDVVSEDLPRQWPRNTGPIRLGRTDPMRSALLVKYFTKSHPSAMTGFIWYRLPVESDVMNWNRKTWERVARGEMPVSELKIESNRSESNPKRIELILNNTGETAAALPKAIILDVKGRGEYQFDGGHLYLGAGDPLEFTLTSGKIDHLPLPAGKTVQVGWIEGDVEVDARIQ